MRPVEEQLEILMRGVAEVYSRDELAEKLAHSVKTGRPLRVKLGIDPTGSDLTLGHSVPLRKLRAFQELGHQVVLIIGDYTAQIGDPSGRNEARPQLTHEQTLANAKYYTEQAAKVLDMNKVELRYNSEWLAPLDFAAIIRLASQVTVAQILERDDFKKRYTEGRPISLHEFFYPLAQGYDSVMVEADIEIGGTDQTFNLLVGRDLQRQRGQAPQVCLTLPIVEGLDGVEKMSKSLGNYIAIFDTPQEMYGKTMSIPDHLITKYFTHFTDVPLTEIAKLEEAMAAGQNPRDVKMRLARELVTLYHSATAAQEAEDHFRQVFQQGGLPAELPEVTIAAGQLSALDLLAQAGLVGSNSEARRLISQGGFSIDGEKVTEPSALIEVRDGQVLRAGKRRFARIRLG